MSAPRTRPRAGGLRIGLVVCTVVVLTAACGSIDVVTGDAGGSGGTPGGGSGGMHAGGSGGSAGAHGSGGAQGSGGITGGGTGGTNRGSGGSNGGGSGGVTGGASGGSSGADAGAGGAGGSGPSCSSIQKAFVIALANAKSCVVGATGYCGVTTLDKLDCGCPTHVNDTKEIDSIRTQWTQSGCSSGVCPGVLCVAYRGAICAVPSGGTSAVCTDTSTLPTP